MTLAQGRRLSYFGAALLVAAAPFVGLVLQQIAGDRYDVGLLAVLFSLAAAITTLNQPKIASLYTQARAPYVARSTGLSTTLGLIFLAFAAAAMAPTWMLGLFPLCVSVSLFLLLLSGERCAS
jgi:hypothetical protein